MASTTNQGCQTQQGDSCKFGTQTYRDFASQYLANSLSSVTHFGTQTVGTQQSPPPMTDRQETFRQELDLDDPTFCSALLLPPECMDFGTQTLDDFPCLHDLGVQTLLPAETKNQGSQTSVAVLSKNDNNGVPTIYVGYPLNTHPAGIEGLS